MRLLTFYLVLIFIVASCSDKTEIPESGIVNGNMLQSLVSKAVSGSIGANRLLSGLIDDNFSERGNYNQIMIDSFYLDGRTFFSVIVEYPNPALNLFAIYDQYLKFFLIDKSLNGNITAMWKKLDDKNLILVSERFNSKDLLKLERLSIYSVDGISAKLLFRSLTKFEKEGKEYFQTITSFTAENIVTTISGYSPEGLTSKRDTFYCNTISGNYLSPNNYFSSFVKNQIGNYEIEPSKQQLTSTGGTTSSPHLVRDEKGFVIGASKDWEEIHNYVVRKDLKRPLAGYTYINKSIGAIVSVIKLPAGSFAEKFLNVKFGDATGTNYKIRSSEMFTRGRKYLQYIEHNCDGQRYLLIFEAPKHSYKENKIVYTTIINSFRIDC